MSVETASGVVSTVSTGGQSMVPDERGKSMPEREPDNRSVALVTGSTRGIGLAIALRLLSEGYHVVCTFRNDRQQANDALRVLYQEAPFGCRVKLEMADVSLKRDVDRMVESVLGIFGHIDVLVNNAGITRDGPILRMSEDDWDAVLDTNLKGPFLCCKAVVPHMMRRRYGRIINIASIVGETGNQMQVNYAAAKGGLIAFTKALAQELGSARRDITVNAVAPGFIDTRMTEVLPEAYKETLRKRTPLERFGTTEDVAGAVAFLVSSDAAFITGYVLDVNGGLYMG